MRLASDSTAQERRRPSRAAHAPGQPARSAKASKAAAQAQALMLFGRWLRVSRRGVAVMNGCGCGFDMAIELGELDEMILDYLQQKFSKTAGLKAFVGAYLSDEKKNGIQRMLETLANGEHTLPADAVMQLLAAVEVSVVSIEENHA